MAREVIVLTHMLGRYLDDFGNVLLYLQREGYDVIVYTSPPRPGSSLSTDSVENYDVYLERLGPSVTVRPLPYVRGGRMKPWSVLQMGWRGAVLARQHPDAMFIMWSVYLILACGIPLRLANRKSLYLVTGLGPVLGGTGRRFRLLRGVMLTFYALLMSGRNSRCLNHNSEDKAVLARRLHADPDKFFVTPGCGVDPALFPFVERTVDGDRPIAVVPARLIADKGILEAVEASNILTRRGVEHEMWFTGAVEPYPWIAITAEEIAEAERVNPAIRFIGFQPSMPAVYEKVDVVCYPTRYPEGTPTALIEAAATGRAAVTCDTVGAREIVLAEETGLVVPQRDPVALAAALERLLTDADLRERLRRNAYRHFLDHYTKDKVLEATLAAFESWGHSFTSERTAPDIRMVSTAS